MIVAFENAFPPPQKTISKSIAHNSISIKRAITPSTVPCLTIHISVKEDYAQNLFINFLLRKASSEVNSQARGSSVLNLNSKQSTLAFSGSEHLMKAHEDLMWHWTEACISIYSRKASGSNMNYIWASETLALLGPIFAVLLRLNALCTLTPVIYSHLLTLPRGSSAVCALFKILTVTNIISWHLLDVIIYLLCCKQGQMLCQMHWQQEVHKNCEGDTLVP